MPSRSSRYCRFELSLFGGPILTERGVRQSLSPLQEAFLSLLGANEPNSGITKDKLLEFLWSNGTAREIRQRLSQLTYSLHRRLLCNDLITSDRRIYTLNSRIIMTDYSTIHALLRDGLVGDAIDIVNKGFLTTLSAPPTVRYERWMLEEGVSVESSLRRVASEVWASAEERGDWRVVDRLAKSLLSLDPTDEEVLRKLLHAKARLGNVSEARAEYRHYCDRLAVKDPTYRVDELTKDLVARLNEIAMQTSETTNIATEPSSSDAPPLVGREEEIRFLHDLISSTPNGEVRSILIAGESGIGKSRLVEEALNRVSLSKSRVMRASCAELEIRVPLNPLIDMIGADWIRDEIESLPEPWRSILIRQLPYGFEGCDILPEVLSQHITEIPRRLCEAFLILVRTVANIGSLIMCIDDIHWADHTTIVVLSYILRRWNKGRLVLVITQRSGIHSSDAPGTTFFEKLAAEGSNHLVKLEELNQEHSSQLISLILGPEGSIELRNQLVAVSGGNPLFLIHTALTHRGQLGLRPSKRLGAQAGVPISLRSLLEDRLSGLVSSPLSILQLLATTARPLPVMIIAQLCRIDISVVHDSLVVLDDRALISWSAKGIRLKHDMIRTVLIENMSEVRWRSLNWIVANYLSGEPNHLPGEVAVHFFRSSLPNLARSPALAAAHAAEAAGAYSEALQYLEMAHSVSVGTEFEEADYLSLVESLYRFGRLERAARLLPDACGRLRQSGEGERAALLELKNLECQLQLGILMPKGAESVLLSTIEHASSSGWWRAASLGLELRVRSLLAIKAPSIEVLKVINKADSYARHINDPEGIVRLQLTSSLRYFFGEAEEGIRAARKGLDVAGRMKRNEPLYLMAANRLLVCLVGQGNLESAEGEKLTSEVQALASISGDLSLRCYPLMNYAVWQMAGGNYNEAIGLLRKVMVWLTGVGAHEIELRVRTNLGLAYLEVGYVRQARLELSRAQAIISPLTPVAVVSTILAALGLCAIQAGNLSAAEKIRPHLVIPSAPWVGDPTVVVRFLAEMLMNAHDFTGARRVVSEAALNMGRSMPLHWTTLTLLDTYISLQGDLPVPKIALVECLEWTKSKGLTRRSSHIASLMRGLDS